MILSASRRTDIPNYYSDWFYDLIRQKYYKPNPNMVIDLSSSNIDCIVFWTKNPLPMMPRLSELSDYQYYFQFTLNSYGTDIEPGVPHKKEMIKVFQKLSNQIGKERVVWRYDPVFFTKVYSREYHLSAFEQIAQGLRGYTNRCVISFVDIYAKLQNRLSIYNPSELYLKTFAAELADIARKNGITVFSCAEKIDLSDYGIEHGACIDKNLIESLIGRKLDTTKDSTQRRTCLCTQSFDIGTYNTCKNGCLYCYANK